MMKRNKRVIEFLKKNYYTIIKQPLTFGYSIQGTMNRIIRSKSVKGLNVSGIDDNIFIDGNTMLNRVILRILNNTIILVFIMILLLVLKQKHFE